VVQFGYSYVEDENNIYRKTFDHRSGDPYNEYSYDDLDRLTGVTYHDTDAEAFVMDDLGNRIGDQTLRADGTVNFAVDSTTNRYTSIAGNSITHDDAGNMTGDKDGYVYFYDYENRIVKIEDLSSSTVATFEYDALGRRIRKVDTVAAVTTLYYYDPDWRCLEERDGSDVVQRSFIYGNYIDEVLALVIPAQAGIQTHYYLHDHLYSPVALIVYDDPDWVVGERYEYDAYGTVHILTSGFSVLSSSQYGNPYTFTGRRLDLLDNGDLEVMYYRHRSYGPYVGRFFQQDPLGYTQGVTLYEYTAARPMNWVDAHGLFASSIHMYFITPGSSMPANGFQQDIVHGRAIYKSVQPPPAIYNPYAGYIDPVGEIIGRAKATADIGGLLGSPQAKRFLLHYLSNTGSAFDSHYPQMLADDGKAYADYERIRDLAVAFIRYNPVTQIFRSIVSLMDEQASPLSVPDWQRAIGGYRIAARAWDIQCNSMQLELELRDYYDWNRNDRKLVGLVSPAELYMLHVWGKAQFFEVYGHYYVYVRWDSNGEITEEREVHY